MFFFLSEGSLIKHLGKGRLGKESVLFTENGGHFNSGVEILSRHEATFL